MAKRIARTTDVTDAGFVVTVRTRRNNRTWSRPEKRTVTPDRVGERGRRITGLASLFAQLRAADSVQKKNQCVEAARASRHGVALAALLVAMFRENPDMTAKDAWNHIPDAQPYLQDDAHIYRDGHHEIVIVRKWRERTIKWRTFEERYVRDARRIAKNPA